MESPNDKIGIVMLGYWLGVSSSIIHTAKSLAEEGFYVEIFVDADKFHNTPIDFSESNINVVVVNLERGQDLHHFPIINLKAFLRSRLRHGMTFELLRKLNRLLIRLRKMVAQIQYLLLRSIKKDYGVHDFISAYGADWSQYLEILTQKVAQEDYLALIGVETEGLLASYYALDIAGAQRTHLIYYNLELLQHNRYMKLKKHFLKDCEIICSRKCDLVIIPDENRGKIFARVNGVEEAKIRYLPVSTSGDPILTKSRYFRDLFGIPDDKKIVLYAGNIIEWAMCHEIVESVDRWCSDFILVMHTWRRDIKSSSYYQELVDIADCSRVYFSTQPVPYERLPAVLSSADVGLLFYKPIDANFMETGSSSNKLAQYVQVGLPVISNDLPSIRRIFNTYGNGICVEHPNQIADALEAIFRDYDKFRKDAFNSYRSHYDFSEAFKPILSELKEMSASKTQDSLNVNHST